MEPVPGIIRKSMSMSPFDGISVVIQKWGQKPVVISVVWGAVMRTWNYLSPDTETNNRFMLAWYVIPSFHRPSYINIQMDMQQVGTISQAMIQRRTQKPRFESIDFIGTTGVGSSEGMWFFVGGPSERALAWFTQRQLFLLLETFHHRGVLNCPWDATWEAKISGYIKLHELFGTEVRLSRPLQLRKRLTKRGAELWCWKSHKSGCPRGSLCNPFFKLNFLGWHRFMNYIGFKCTVL